jgi:dihydroorotate dehydrogenase (fumarate)/dihydropyrimidine dehydrogenase (NAD+) subunit PreA
VPRAFTLFGRCGAIELTLEEYLPILKEANRIAGEHGAVLIGSGDGPAVGDWLEQAKRMEDAGIRMVEFNFGCPHPGSEEDGHKRTAQIGQDVEFASEIIHNVTNAVSIPVVVKCTPQVVDLVDVVKSLKSAGASAVTISNRFVGFLVDIESATPLLSSWAGVGGPWVKPITLRWISQVYRALPDFPISGSNGPYDWRDVVEFMMSGATTVQLCSALLVKGIGYIGKVVDGLNDFLDKKGYASAGEIIGLAARSALPMNEVLMQERFRSHINMDKCTLCGNCIRSCMFSAIEREGDNVRVNDRCVGCEICFNVCPSDAIDLVPVKT